MAVQCPAVSQPDAGSIYRRQASAGSLWATASVRCKHFGAAGPAHQQDQIVRLPRATTCAVMVACSPVYDSEQAGLYAFHDAENWAKLVLEQLRGDLYLIFASQEDGVPFVSGKVKLSSRIAVVDLRLDFDEASLSLRALYREPSPASHPGCGASWAPDAWTPVCRGVGWKLPTELTAAEQSGRLEEGHPAAAQTAVVTAPHEWTFALISEQWQHSAEVVFSVLL